MHFDVYNDFDVSLIVHHRHKFWVMFVYHDSIAAPWRCRKTMPLHSSCWWRRRTIALLHVTSSGNVRKTCFKQMLHMWRSANKSNMCGFMFEEKFCLSSSHGPPWALSSLCFAGEMGGSSCLAGRTVRTVQTEATGAVVPCCMMLNALGFQEGIRNNWANISHFVC